jgi:hypothetical protein
MSDYLITSREGLFIFNSITRTFTKIQSGHFFGLAKHRDLWYVFSYLGEPEERINPSFVGMITSFNLNYDSSTQTYSVNNWSVQHLGLDNGSHQLKIYDDKLYLVETYIQTIKVFDIKEDGTLVLSKSHTLYPTVSPVANAHYVISGIGAQYTCQGYKHINALTIHDNLIYLSCPSLRNNIINNKPTQDTSQHVIEVYDMSFTFLWSFTIPDQVFCHDIVFQGHTAYFLAPPNKLCSLDIVTKESKVNATFDIQSMHPRGLSIDEYGNTVIGFRNENAIAVCDINMQQDPNHPLTTIPAPCAPCFVAKIDYDRDYNNASSKLVKPYVMQVPMSSLPIDTTPLEAIVRSVLDNDKVWSQCQDTRACFQQGANFFSNPTLMEYPISQVKEPPSFLFADIRTLQQVTSHKVHISNLTNIPTQELQDVYYDIMAKMSEYKEKVKERVLHVSGDLYLYPPNSALGWHTNLEEPSNYDTCRCYLIFTNKDNESFFLYRHPMTQQIHAVPDRSNYANIFDLGKPSSPLWHAVYNNSTEMSRLSVGIAFHKYRMGAFSKLMNDIQKIHH